MKLITLLLTISLLTACQGKPNHDFSIKGTIKNYTKAINLYEFKNFKEQPKFIATIQPSPKGDFYYSLKTNEEGIYFILAEKSEKYFAFFVNDTSKININIDGEITLPFTVQTSKASIELMNFLQFEAILKDSLIKNITSSNAQLNNIDSVITKFQSKFNKDLLDYYSKISNSNVKGFLLVTILSMSNTQKEENAVKELLEQALQQHPDNKYLKEIKQKIESNYFSMKNQNTNSSKLPSFSLPNTEGKTVSIDEFKGKYFLLDFWASWCGYCRQESPYLVQAYNKFKNKNFTIVSISLDEDKEAWLKAITKDKLTWTHLSDLKGWESQAAQMFGVSSIPFNLLIDPQGNIIASELRGDALEEKLKEVLK